MVGGAIDDGPFNAKKARTKHAIPLWVDSFLRKTMTLSVEQIGAYNLILFAMWGRQSCDLPVDDAQLASVCRVSKTLWLRKFKPVLWPFFEVIDEALVSDRLQKEAVFVEKYLQSQSDKKRGKTSPKILKTNEPPSSGDKSTDKSGDHPTQQPNNPKEVDKSTSTQEVEDYQNYLDSHPKPVESVAGEKAWCDLIEAGEDPKVIIGLAKAYADKIKGWSSDAKVQQSDNFLAPDRGKWREFQSQTDKSEAAAMSRDAKRIREHDAKKAGPIKIHPEMAKLLISQDFITVQEAQDAGIQI
jgi:uncharacterized protein YdaU (DUF1376 family)